MKVRDAIKLIQQDGWFLKRTRGDHRVYVHTSKGGIVVIPGHLGSDLATGTLSSILQTGGAEIMRFAVIIEKTGTGYSAYVPDLPGCVSVGRTREEMDRNIREAIELYLDELRMQGASIPEPTTDAEYIAV